MNAQQPYDVVVVGASFAGLSFASAAAVQGMRVLVLERDPVVGGVVRTTGVLFSDVLTLIDVPSRYLMNAVNRLILHVPNQPMISVGSASYRFFMADVTGMLQWMAEGAQDHGVEIRCGSTFTDATMATDGVMSVAYTAKGSSGATTVAARFLIGADGAQSQVARKLGLDTNANMLAGAEWLIEGVTVPSDTFRLVMNQTLAPGYCLWLAPHGNITALGVAGHAGTFKPNVSLEAARAIFGQYVDMSQMRIVQRKGGVIPVGNALRRVHRDDAGARVLLLGDAAGLCGAATGGGIYPALVAGRLAAGAVANTVLNGSTRAVPIYLRDLPRTSGLGDYLRIEGWLRRAMDRTASDADLAAFYGVFTAAQGEALLRRILFETPIVSMNTEIFGLVRRLFTQGSLYGATLRALWQRIAAWRGPQTAASPPLLAEGNANPHPHF
ncbi:MAG: FAD-dependent monooxygenase [Ktedonobacterales bacterium]|nr:FAD-dependent monooxygenase [Ktedonobacterales bacterium]